jgi:hypothetical protein
MWVITTLSYLITALCLVLLCFTARMMVQRIHTASKKHGLAFFRDRDSRRISQLLIIVMFIMGLGLEEMGVPLGPVAGSFFWWKYLLFIGLTITLISELGTDVMTIVEEIRACAKGIFKVIRPAEKPAREPAINPEFNSHRPPVNEMNTTNQHQPWTPKEVVDQGEFMEVADEADEIAPLVEEGDYEDLFELSDFAEMADTADDVLTADLALEEGTEDALDLNSPAEMADDVPAEDRENPDLEKGTESEDEDEDDMREFPKDFS